MILLGHCGTTSSSHSYPHCIVSVYIRVRNGRVPFWYSENELYRVYWVFVTTHVFLISDIHHLQSCVRRIIEISTASCGNRREQTLWSNRWSLYTFGLVQFMKNSIENVRSNKWALFDSPCLRGKKKKQKRRLHMKRIVGRSKYEFWKSTLNKMIISLSCAEKIPIDTCSTDVSSHINVEGMTFIDGDGLMMILRTSNSFHWISSIEENPNPQLSEKESKIYKLRILIERFSYLRITRGGKLPQVARTSKNSWE